MKAHELKKHLREQYPQILFKEGAKHTHFSVNGGLSWSALNLRHSTQDIKKGAIKGVQRDIEEQLQIVNSQSQKNAQSLDPKQWAEEVKALNLFPNPKIYENPNEQGFYQGKILHKDADSRFCVQKIGERSLFIHNARKFPEGLPKRGDVVRINYREGVAQVSPVKEIGKERGSRSR